MTVDGATWLKVNDVLQGYADALDRGDIPAILALFTPDAVWAYSPTMMRQGHLEIRAFFEERMSVWERTSHNVAAPVVRAGQGVVHSTAYFMAKHLLRAGGSYAGWGRYVDEMVPDGSRLRIARRAVVAHAMEGTARSYNMLSRVSA